MTRQLIDLEVQTNWGDLPSAGVPTKLNKGMTASVTTGDGDVACSTAMAATPASDGYVTVRLNGQARELGDETAECYFSADGGTTARAIADIALGDLLYWNGSVAGFQLAVTDVLDFDYDEAVGGTGGGSTAGLYTTGILELWVRAVDGDDGNTGETVDAPLATQVEAEARIPHIVNHPVIIRVGPHTGDGYNLPTFRPRILNANIYVIGDGAGDPGGSDGFNEIVASSVAQSGSDISKVVTTGGMGTTQFGAFGEHTGRVVEILTSSGNAVGDRRTLRGNAADELYPVVDFTEAISAGDTYRIVEPAIAIKKADKKEKIAIGCGNRTVPTHPSSSEKHIWFINFKVPADDLYWYCADSSLILLGIQWAWDMIFDAPRCSFRCGWETWYQGLGWSDEGCPSTVADLGVAHRFNWAGWTVSSRRDAWNSGLYINRGLLDGCFVAGSLMAVDADSLIWVQACALWGEGLQAIWHNSYIRAWPASGKIVVGSTLTPGAAIRAHNGGLVLANCNVVGDMTVKGDEEACLSEYNGYIHLMSATASAIALEAAGHGIKVRYNSTVFIDGELPAVTSGIADFTVDDGATGQPISDLATTPYIYSHLDHGRVMRKV